MNDIQWIFQKIKSLKLPHKSLPKITLPDPFTIFATFIIGLLIVFVIVLTYDLIFAVSTGTEHQAIIVEKIHEPSKTNTRLETVLDYDGNPITRVVTETTPEKWKFVIRIPDFGFKTTSVSQANYYGYEVDDTVIAKQSIGALGITRIWRIHFPNE